MLKRTIYISSDLKVSVKNTQLILTDKESNIEVSKIPVEDMACLIIDNALASITIPAINELTNQNVGILICNAKGMPSAMINPLEANTLQGQRYRIQLEASLPAKKSIWQQLIAAKIKNQSYLLNRLNLDGDILKTYYKNVKSDDSDNREGVAARIYWSMLFGPKFARSREGSPPNNLLNYGYSILRAATARAIVGAGLLPALGIHHRNRSNAYPLADDFMEPFRPFVDYLVYNMVQKDITDVDKRVKAELINVLYVDTIVRNKLHPLSIALEMLCTSAIKIMQGESKSLSIPSFVDL